MASEHTKLQIIFIVPLGISTVALSILWVMMGLSVYFEPSFLSSPFISFISNVENHLVEPFVVSFASTTALFNFWWPFSVKRDTYDWHKLIIFEDYNKYNGKFHIGEGDYKFTLQFGNSGTDKIYIYKDPPNIKSIALAKNFDEISKIKNASSWQFDFTKRRIMTSDGQIVILENKNGYFACVRIIQVTDSTREDKQDMVVFEYVINKRRGTNFWKFSDKCQEDREGEK